MKALLSVCMASLCLAPAALAQDIEKGPKVQRSLERVRVKFLPWQRNDVQPYESELEKMFLSKYGGFEKVSQGSVELSIEENLHNLPQFTPANIVALSQKIKADIFVSGSAIQTENGFWLILRVYRAPDGRILDTQKILTPELSASAFQRLTAQIDTNKLLNKIKHVYELSSLNPEAELHLLASPPETQVTLDSVVLGETPMIIRNLQKQSYKLELQDSQGLKNIQVQINSDPPQVSVSLDGKFLGKTPLLVTDKNLKVGKQRFSFQADSDYEIDMSFVSEPTDIKVKLTDRAFQRTPIRFEQIKEEHIDVEVFPPGVKVIKKLNLEPGITTYKLELYKKAQIFFKSPVSPVNVFVDNEAMGETPLSLTLSQGLHELYFEKRRYKNKRIEVDLEGGKDRYITVELEPKTTNSSIFLIPTANMTSRIQAGATYLGFGRVQDTLSNEELPFQLAGLEASVGWPDVFQYGIFELGIGGSLFGGLKWQDNVMDNFQGIGLKLQFLKEGDVVPISAALGGYTNIAGENTKATGFLSLTRHFWDLALHVGLQTHGMSLGVDYTGFENLQIGGLLYSDTFFKFLGDENRNVDTLYGLRLGYQF